MSRIITGAGVVALLAFAASRTIPDARAEGRSCGWSDWVAVPRSAEKTIERWPARAGSAARITMARYGMPNEVGEEALVWRANGPWKKTTVHRRAWLRHALWADKGHLENAIAYDVPSRSLKDLARFNNMLAADPARSELSSLSENEEENYLALNLADEIINGKRSVAQARAFQAKILRLADSGKSSPYLKGLLFAANGGVFSPANPYP